METAQQLDIRLPNGPGSLAKLGDRLRASDVNIDAIFCTSQGNESLIHLIVDDVETAKMVIREIAPVETCEVFAFRLKNTPGSIAQIARVCAGAGINIDQIYATTLGNEAMVYVKVDKPKEMPKFFK